METAYKQQPEAYFNESREYSELMYGILVLKHLSR